MKIVAIIEARMTSSRLPGKVLKEIIGKPAIELLIERLRSVKEIHEIMVATTVNTTDDVIEALCRRLYVVCFRGSENDVLGRVLQAAQSIEANIIVEITGDCPLADPDIIRRGINMYLKGNYDYVGNGCFVRTFPDGMDVQIFSVKLLEGVNILAQETVDREHVTHYIYTHPECYKIGHYEADGELHWPELAITLDTPEDLVLISKIFEELYPRNSLFTAYDIVRFLRQRPDLLGINTDQQRLKNFLTNTPRSLGAKK